MGRFSSVVVLLLAACGDNLEVDEGAGPGPADVIDPSDNATTTPRYVPSVCGVQTWTTNVAANPAMNVSVVPRADGAVVLATPRDGGALTGYVLDTRMNMVSQNKVAVDGTFTDVVASYVNNRLVSASIQDGAVFLNLLDQDLGSPQAMTKLPGRHVADPAFYQVQHDVVMPVAGDDGVSLHRFDAAYQRVDSKLVVPSGPVRAMAAAQLGVAMFGVWTTDDACHMMQTSTFSAGMHTELAVTCPDPRVAVDQKTGAAVIVFGSDDGVRLTTNLEAQTGGSGHLLRTETSAPRTVFDGTNFWVSYLDSRGDVIVGFLDANRRIVSMSLAGPKPERGAYELVIVDGSPWVFSLGSEGYSAYRMCVDAQW